MLSNFSWDNDSVQYQRISTNLMFPLTLMVIVIFTTIVGNILVIISVCTYRPLRNAPNAYLVSLAVADLAVAVFVMPLSAAYFAAGRWQLGRVTCQIWLTTDMLVCTASILNLCAIAVDRYRAIYDPVNYAIRRTIGKLCLWIAVIWCASTVISLPPLFGLYDIGADSCHLSRHKAFVVYSAFGSFYIPLVLIAVLYAKIFHAIRQRLRQRVAAARKSKRASRESSALQEGTDATSVTGNSDVDTTRATASLHADKQLRISLSKERRAARTMSVIVGAFVLCWLPFFVAYITLSFCDECLVDDSVSEILVWLGYVNSSINPIIYTAFNRQFRHGFKRIFSSRCCG